MSSMLQHWGTCHKINKLCKNFIVSETSTSTNKNIKYYIIKYYFANVPIKLYKYYFRIFSGQIQILVIYVFFFFFAYLFTYLQMLREHFILDIMGMFMNTQKTLKSNKL